MGESVQEKVYKQKRDGLFSKLMEGSLYLALIIASYWLAFKLNITGGYDLRNAEALKNSTLLIVLAATAILMTNRVFETVRKSFIENAIVMTMVSCMTAVFVMAIAFYSREFALPRSLITVAFFIQMGVLSVAKCIIIVLLKRFHGVRQIMVIAPAEEKEMLISKLLSDPRFPGQLRYYAQTVTPAILERIHDVDRVIVSDALAPEALDSVVQQVMEGSKKMYIIPRAYEIAILNSEFTQYSDIPVLKIDNLYLSWEKRTLKRVMDLAISIPALILLLPLMMVVALAIFITDGRPIFYTQKRVTLGNRVFKVIKFRSMINDAEKISGAVLACEEDPRITAVGRFLRRFWLDELPQLFNVIKGDMSLVGPRPERPVFVEEFSRQFPHFKYRLTAKAGVTGLAQVMGRYTTSPENKLKFDLMYIRNAGIAFDLRILLETAKKILMGTLRRGEKKDHSYKEALRLHTLVESLVDSEGMVVYHRAEATPIITSPLHQNLLH